MEHIVVVEDTEVNRLSRKQGKPLHRRSHLIDEIPSIQRRAHESEKAQTGAVTRWLGYALDPTPAVKSPQQPMSRGAVDTGARGDFTHRERRTGTQQQLD